MAWSRIRNRPRDLHLIFFTIGRRFSSSYAVLAFLQIWWFSLSILDFRSRERFLEGFDSVYSLAELKNPALFLSESRCFLLATIPWLFNFRLIVDACKFVPDATREICSTREMRYGFISLVLQANSFDGRLLLGRDAVMLKTISLEIICLPTGWSWNLLRMVSEHCSDGWAVNTRVFISSDISFALGSFDWSWTAMGFFCFPPSVLLVPTIKSGCLND